MKNYFFILLFMAYFCSSYAQTDEFMSSKWRLNLSGGLGYLTAGTAIEENSLISLGLDEKKVKNLYSDFRTGIQGGADIHYFLNENIGIGMKYSFFTTNGSIQETIPSPYDGSSNLTLEFKETDAIHFIGPSLHTHSFIGNSWWAFSLTVSGGYAGFNGKPEASEFYNNTKANSAQMLVKGNAFGAFGGIGLEYWLNNRIALGLDIGYFHLAFDNLKVENDQENNPELEDSINSEDNDYSRFDLSLGLKFYF